MVPSEQLKVQRHKLYCSIADACQQGGPGGDNTAAELLSQLQAVLEAESCLSCVDDEQQPGQQSPSLQEQPALPRKHQHRSSSKKTSAAKASAAASAVQLLKNELAQKLHAAVQQRSPSSKAGQTSGTMVAELAAAQQAHARLEDQLLEMQAAALRQRQQHEHDVKSWRLAAEQAASIAEQANHRACSAESKLAETAQHFAEQTCNTLKLGDELKQAQRQLACRWQQERQLYSAILRPLLQWQQSQPASSNGRKKSCTAIIGNKLESLDKLVNSECSALLDNEGLIETAAAAVEHLLVQHLDKQAAVLLVRQDMQAQHEEAVQQLCNERQQLQQQLQLAADTINNLQPQLKQTQQDLSAVQQQRAADHEHIQQLQQQLADDAAAATEQQQQLQALLEQQHGSQLAAAVQQATAAAEAKAEQQMQAKDQLIQELQQQLSALLCELAAAQEQAADAEQQAGHLQEQLQQVVSMVEQQQCEHEQELQVRLVQQQADDLDKQRSTLQQLVADKAAALATAERQAAAAVQAVEREQRLALQEAQHSWQKEKAALEAQRVEAVLQARLAAQQQLEKERQQWQFERDALITKLAADQASIELRAQHTALQQQQDLLEQLAALKQERQLLNERLVAACAAPVVKLYDNSQADAIKFSQALTAAEADRQAALKQAAAAQREVQQLLQQSQQQEQELQLMRRALDEMQHACQAANDASREAEASSAASAAALQEQLRTVRQLQVQIDTLQQQYGLELRDMQQSMRQQVAAIQNDARTELEAAQTRMQLLRYKQQRMAKCLASTTDAAISWRDAAVAQAASAVYKG